MEKTAVYLSPLGKILLAAEEEQITGLWFWGQKYFPQRLEGAPLTQGALCWSRPNSGFAGTSPGKGRSPSNSCCSGAPPSSGRCGSCCARSPTGRPSPTGSCPRPWPAAGACPVFSAQAVGGAVGRNPISLLVPCHRVVGAGGSLTGYAGGLERKRRLLELERGVLFEG